MVAISVDAPEVTRQHCQKLGFTYTFLSDQNAEVIRRYDLLHQGGGPKGADIARPAEFLIDSTGTIRWINLTDSVTGLPFWSGKVKSGAFCPRRGAAAEDGNCLTR